MAPTAPPEGKTRSVKLHEQEKRAVTLEVKEALLRDLTLIAGRAVTSIDEGHAIIDALEVEDGRRLIDSFTTTSVMTGLIGQGTGSPHMMTLIGKHQAHVTTMIPNTEVALLLDLVTKLFQKANFAMGNRFADLFTALLRTSSGTGRAGTEVVQDRDAAAEEALLQSGGGTRAAQVVSAVERPDDDGIL